MQADDHSKAAGKVTRLVKLAEDLRGGRDFSITRLTILKALCEDPVAAARFGLHITNLTKAKATKRYRPLIDRAIREIGKQLENPSAQPAESAFAALHALEDAQQERKRFKWVDVRIIHSKEALLAECALRCATRPSESAHWGYHLARHYAERYDPRYGTGLIPASAAAVEEIAAFWNRYLLSADGRVRRRWPPRPLHR